MVEPSTRDVLTVTGTARPKRVAFLVDPDAITVEDLDSITQRCSSYWGGGFWPIVPTDGLNVTQDWWSVLEAVDPDIVYALCTLSDQLFDRVHRRLTPAVLVNAGPALPRAGNIGRNRVMRAGRGGAWPTDRIARPGLRGLRG